MGAYGGYTCAALTLPPAPGKGPRIIPTRYFIVRVNSILRIMLPSIYFLWAFWNHECENAVQKWRTCIVVK